MYVETTTTATTNGACDEITRTINHGNACYYPVRKFLSSHLNSRTMNIEYKV